jgi:TolA-binding protein
VKELEEQLSKALKRIEELESFEKENKLLKKRIEELEEVVKEKSKPSFVKEDVRSYHHKTGQKEGHEGVSRETPEKIDEIKSGT